MGRQCREESWRRCSARERVRRGCCGDPPQDLSMADGQLDFAKKAGMEVAISGGGHSASGASSSEGGLVIDLKRMRKASVDTSTNRVVAQGGCLWIDVEQALAEHKLATGKTNNNDLAGADIQSAVQ